MEACQVKKVVIIGGGTAGWLTAGRLRSALKSDGEAGVEVVLVESDLTPTIGVGEGTWPSIRSTLKKIGITEAQLFNRASAAFKQGSKFTGWVTGEESDIVYHPFNVAYAYRRAGHSLAGYWNKVASNKSFAATIDIQEDVCRAGLAPKDRSYDDYEGPLNYAYHIDATALAKLLQEHCCQCLGVQHYIGHVNRVVKTENGTLSSIMLDNGNEIAGDLFIDCTGFAARLIGQEFGSQITDLSKVFFANAALATQVDYESPDVNVQCQTVSTARSAGWVWDIGLSSRRGVGYVYSKEAVQSDDDAAQELASYLGQSVDSLNLKQVSFTPGYRPEPWIKNCVAIGLSGGFLEPLEASAIVLIDESISMLIEMFPAKQDSMTNVALVYNKRWGVLWDGVIQFLKLHYVLNKRSEPFWQESREPQTVPESLQLLIDSWKYREPSIMDISTDDSMFPWQSYHYILYGKGYVTSYQESALRFDQESQAEKYFKETEEVTRRSLAQLPSHRKLLNTYIKQ